MRIAIDLRIFGSEPGGIGRYNEKLLEELIKQDKINSYFLIFKNKPKIKLPDNFQVVICNYHWYSLREQLLLPILLYKLKVDLVHFTHFNVPIFYRSKFVVTIHDLIMTRFPSQRATTLSWPIFKLKYLFYNLVISRAVAKSQKIIAVSKFTAQDIKNHFNLKGKQAEKIKVIYEGISQLTKENRNFSENNFNFPEHYFLYVGNAYPHKNLNFLINAFQEFIKKKPDYFLLLIGKKNYFYQRLERELNCPNVIFTDYLSDDELLLAYRRAKAYIFPSLFEGFGLPPLEAMAQSLPVLSSQASCLPEILGEAALYFNPKDKTDLLKKMEEISSNQALRSFLIQKGLKQTEKYSWAKMTNQILKIYQNE